MYKTTLLLLLLTISTTASFCQEKLSLVKIKNESKEKAITSERAIIVYANGKKYKSKDYRVFSNDRLIIQGDTLSISSIDKIKAFPVRKRWNKILGYTMLAGGLITGTLGFTAIFTVYVFSIEPVSQAVVAIALSTLAVDSALTLGGLKLTNISRRTYNMNKWKIKVE